MELELKSFVFEKTNGMKDLGEEKTKIGASAERNSLLLQMNMRFSREGALLARFSQRCSRNSNLWQRDTFKDEGL